MLSWMNVVKKFRKPGLEGSSIQRIPNFNLNDFFERIDLLKNYCDLIKTQDKEYQILMKNQLLVTLVSTIEYNLKAFFSYLIDDMDIDPKNIRNIKKFGGGGMTMSQPAMKKNK